MKQNCKWLWSLSYTHDMSQQCLYKLKSNPFFVLKKIKIKKKKFFYFKIQTKKKNKKKFHLNLNSIKIQKQTKNKKNVPNHTTTTSATKKKKKIVEIDNRDISNWTVYLFVFVKIDKFDCL